LDLKAKLLYDLLIVSHLEGEDLSLSQVVDALYNVDEYRHLLKALEHELGDLPPRIVFAKLRLLNAWHESLSIAARQYLENHLLASLDKKLDNWKRVCRSILRL